MPNYVKSRKTVNTSRNNKNSLPYRKRYNRKKSRGTSTVTNSRNIESRMTTRFLNPGPSGSVFPDRLFTNLTWSSYGSTTGQLTAIPFNVIRLNSLYDPIYAVGGDQPTGRDELAAIYNKYRVYGAEFKFVIDNTELGEAIDVCVVASNNVLAGAQVREQVLRSRRCWKMYLGAPESSTISKAVFKGFLKPRDIIGLSKLNYSTSDDTQAFENASPAKVAYLNFVAFRHNDPHGVVTNAFNYSLDMKFFSEFYERVRLPTS